MRYVYGVHAVYATEVRPTQLVCSTEQAACREAGLISDDPGVLAAGVTRYVLDETGQRSPTALYVAGTRQQVPYVSDCRTIFAGGRKHT